jgi:TusA-related sulfurtransferase
MELNPPGSRTVDVRGLDMPLPLERARDAIEVLAPGEALKLFASDAALEHPLRELCQGKGYEFVDGSEPGTLCFLIYRPF